MTTLLPIALGVLLLGLAYLRFRQWRQRRRVEQSLRRALGDPPRPPSGGRLPSRAVPNHTRQKLLKLLGNHQPTIDRLLEQARWHHPGQSEQWYWEKVLYDLERDRWR
jgi:hypothetical protein